jgi:hypothetical protein
MAANEYGMSKGLKILLWVLGGLFLGTALLVGGGIYVWQTKGDAWRAELQEMGRKVKAEGEAAGANASKDECIRLAVARMKRGTGLMDQVRVELFLETCLGVATGTIPYCKDAPKESEIMATVSWRLKTSQALGLLDADNPIVKGIQNHCVGR